MIALVRFVEGSELTCKELTIFKPLYTTIWLLLRAAIYNKTPYRIRRGMLARNPYLGGYT